MINVGFIISFFLRGLKEFIQVIFKYKDMENFLSILLLFISWIINVSLLLKIINYKIGLDNLNLISGE